MDNNLIVHQGNDYMQMMPMAQAKEWYEQFSKFCTSILRDNLDFGTIPGTAKPSLYKPGAEKLRNVYGLSVTMSIIEKTIDLKTPFIDFEYKCTVTSKNGQVLAECDANCNSMEAKYGWVWKPASELPTSTDLSKLPSKTSGKVISEFVFSVEKAETTGNYGKPQAYWDMFKEAIQKGEARKVTKTTKAGKSHEAWEINNSITVYKVLNPDVLGHKNTIMKMAQKRAFVGAILIATGASEFFTQDMEDFADEIFMPYEEVTAYTQQSVKVNAQQQPQQTAAQQQPEVKQLPFITSPQLQKVLDRVNAGDLKAYESALKAFQFNDVQKLQLEEALKKNTPTAQQTPANKEIPAEDFKPEAASRYGLDQAQMNLWREQLSKCKTVADLQKLYTSEEKIISKYPPIIGLFSARRTQIQNNNKTNQPA